MTERIILCTFGTVLLLVGFVAGYFCAWSQMAREVLREVRRR